MAIKPLKKVSVLIFLSLQNPTLKPTLKSFSLDKHTHTQTLTHTHTPRFLTEDYIHVVSKLVCECNTQVLNLSHLIIRQFCVFFYIKKVIGGVT